MKNRSSIYAALLTVFVLSCEKNAEIGMPSNDILYPVSFKITGFTELVEPMSKSQESQVTAASENDPNAVQTYLEVLDYFVYDESGKLRVRHKQQKALALPPYAYYGETAFELPLGTYKLIVVGSMGGVTFGDSSLYSSAYLRPSGDYPNIIEDIFYKEITFTVDGEHDVNETINLKRIVGSLEVRLSENTTDLWGGEPNVEFTSVIKYPFDENQEYEPERFLLPRISGSFEKWKTIDFVYKGFVLPDRSGNFDISPSIDIRGLGSGYIAFRVFENRPLQPNKRLIISGSLTGEHVHQHFNVIADSTWGGSDLVEFEGME